MKITVFGTGGVGGYFGARLAQAGCDVGFVARGAHLAALRERGLRVTSELGDAALAHVRAAADPRELGVPDWAFVCVKLWDTDAAVGALAPAVGPGTAVISFQNGVQKDDVLRPAFGPERVVGGVAYISAGIAEPGVIRHTGRLAKLAFGEYGGGESARTTALLDVARRAGIDAALAPDVTRAIWEKFAFLVGMSGATASMRTTIGPVREHPRTRAFLLGLMREVVAVGNADLAAAGTDARLDEERVVGGMFAQTDAIGDYRTSMALDYVYGRPLEAEAIHGEVARRAESLGVAAPSLATLYAIVRAADARVRGEMAVIGREEAG